VNYFYKGKKKFLFGKSGIKKTRSFNSRLKQIRLNLFSFMNPPPQWTLTIMVLNERPWILSLDSIPTHQIMKDHSNSVAI
jgi:hypothetical protein